MTAVIAEALALQRMYRWEKNEPDKVVFTQPYEGASRGGQVRTWTWRQALDETRRMAAYLKGLNLPPRSHIARPMAQCAEGSRSSAMSPRPAASKARSISGPAFFQPRNAYWTCAKDKPA